MNLKRKKMILLALLTGAIVNATSSVSTKILDKYNLGRDDIKRLEIFIYDNKEYLVTRNRRGDILDIEILSEVKTFISGAKGYLKEDIDDKEYTKVYQKIKTN